MRVYVSQALPEPSTTELLREHEVVLLASVAPLDLSRLADADALLSTPPFRVTAELLALAPRLRVVANCAVGTDNIDLTACRARGIPVTNTPDVLTEATADLTWALILTVARRLSEAEALLRSGAWDGWKPTELLGLSLAGKTLGVYGAGRIGRAVVRRGAAFGMRVLTTTSRSTGEEFEELLTSPTSSRSTPRSRPERGDASAAPSSDT